MFRGRWIPLLLIAVTLLCYSRLFKAEFVLFDDVFTVQYNPNLLPPSVANVIAYWKPFKPDGKVNEQYGLYMPLTYTFWSVVATVAQTRAFDPSSQNAVELNPYTFHIANVLLHATNGLLVYWILRQLLKSEWPACVGALIFILHPVQVEAVGWVSGAKDLLAGSFALFAIGEFLLLRRTTNRAARQAHYAFVLLATFAAMSAKPSAVTLPAILLAVDAMIVKEPLQRSIRTLLPTILFAACFAWLGVRSQPASDVLGAPIWARMFVVGDALAFYLFKIVMPLRLGIDYGRAPATLLPHMWFYFSWLTPAIFIAVQLRLRRISPMAILGTIVFFIAALPTLGFSTFLFQRFSTTADHYLYLPMLGTALIAGAMAERLRSILARTIAILILLSLGLLSIRQSGFWINDRALYLHALEVNPRSFLAEIDLASDALRAGNLEEAQYRINASRAAQPYLKANVDMLESQLRQVQRMPATRPQS